ncbi:MAG TPA: SRPBCC family protein [Candidatus Baltobacteraceae bacterium]|nr:SRPBCC family protein [Candidatus Baltobacteraceae bacterium]
MTETRTAITIAAPPERIYRLAAATERWPEYLPHYRSVRVLEERGETRVVAMAARRDWIPIQWIAEQTNDPARPAIRFRHVRGWTRGMEVEWTFEPLGDGTRVTIEHHLRFRFPVAAEWLGEHVVGGFFIEYVARKTLARMKALAEGGA